MKNKRLLEFPFDARNEILRLAGIIYEQEKLVENLRFLIGLENNASLSGAELLYGEASARSES